jgi:catechol 2,3-dioxygenase-like lactoylglutathione lyase family enzyme
MDTEQITGLHHVTAIVGDPQRNVNFYAGLLGQRLVKKTINSDDPETYHLYYGDEQGHPGTLITFFPWREGAPKGRHGTGQIRETSFSIPLSALDYWQERLRQHKVEFDGPIAQFGAQVISFDDPDGLHLRLVAHEGAELRSGWVGGPIPDEYAIRGIRGVTLAVADHQNSEVMLQEVLGFKQVGAWDNRIQYQLGEGAKDSRVELLLLPNEPRGRIAMGSVHHVAWRTPDDEQQIAWRERLLRLRRDVTPVLDRNYFHSIYFHEPAGVLFEIATDPPGFAVDEPPAELGTHLMLPPWLEAQRSHLEKTLPQLQLPGKME